MAKGLQNDLLWGINRQKREQSERMVKPSDQPSDHQAHGAKVMLDGVENGHIN